MEKERRLSNVGVIGGGPRDGCAETCLIGLFSAAPIRPAIDVSEITAGILADVGRLLQRASILMQFADEVGGPPVFQQDAPRAGDKLPDGPRIPHDKLGTPYAKSNDGGFVDLTKKTIYGPTNVLWFNGSAKDCDEYAIIQLSRLKVEEWDTDAKKWSEHSDTHDWDVDGESSHTDPTNSSVVPASDEITKTFPGAKHYTDTPGTPADPWNNPSMRGKKFRYTHDFETYIVCLKPKVQSPGALSWGYVMEVTIGTDKASTSASYPDAAKKPSRPKWNDGAKDGHLKDGLNKWPPQRNLWVNSGSGSRPRL